MNWFAHETHEETRKDMKRKQPDNDSPLRIGPLVMRLGTERDPRLRTLTDQEAVEEALALMAFSLNLLRESVSIELKTKDEARVEQEVSRWLAEFDRLGQRWREEWERHRETNSPQGNHL